MRRLDLVVLDESFAALDPGNLQRALRCVNARTRTVLAIAPSDPPPGTTWPSELGSAANKADRAPAESKIEGAPDELAGEP